MRSHVSGAELETVWPGARVTSRSLGSVWQSVERHHTSEPLVTVKDCALVPTFIVQAVADELVRRIDSCGFSPWAYSALSDSASTVISLGPHSTGPAGVEGVAVGDGDEDVDDVGAGAAVEALSTGAGVSCAVGAERHGGAATSHTTRPITSRARSPAARRRRR